MERGFRHQQSLHDTESDRDRREHSVSRRRPLPPLRLHLASSQSHIQPPPPPLSSRSENSWSFSSEQRTLVHEPSYDDFAEMKTEPRSDDSWITTAWTHKSPPHAAVRHFPATTPDKTSLSFILDENESLSDVRVCTPVTSFELTRRNTNSPSSSVHVSSEGEDMEDRSRAGSDVGLPRTRSPSGASRSGRPANRTCKFEGCEQYVVDHGLCVRHGGGKRCLTEGCSSRAKHFGRCWRHGGSMECKVDGCINRAKSRGFCWSHGGGTKCKGTDCEKIAISNGLCWAHGGGKRCIVDGCKKQAYERTKNYCNSHFRMYKKQGFILQ